MIPELSHLLTILAAGLFLFSFLVILSSNALSSNDSIIRLSLNCFNAATIFLISAFILYVYLAVMDDFSVKYIAMHSNSDLPIFYKISSIWSSHEGSMFLWILFLSMWLWLFVNRLDTQSNLFRYVIFFSAMVLLFFLLFLLVTSSPFERILPLAPINGGDINPVLQDPALVIHPPMLYLGYVGFAVPFVYICAYLADGEFRQGWEIIIQMWSLYAWAFLTLGIGLGSWWAYYELGWGGYWFWDPVENVALMPWLAATAFTHSIHASTKSGVLKSWTLFLGLSVFILSLFGAFIVRSGIIDSVHAFANDPDRGLYLLGFIGLIVFISVSLFILRLSSIQSLSRIKKFSKQSFISINNILFGALIFSVMLGVTYPLIYEFLFDQKISVGAPFYNAIFIPIVVLAAIFLFFSVDSKWSRSINLKFISTPISFSILLSLAFTLFVMQYFESKSISILASIFAGSLIIFRYIYEIISFIFSKKFINPFSVIAHMSLGLLLISISFNSLLSTERALSIDLNSTEAYKDLKISFKDIGVENNANYDSIKATFLVEDQTGRTFNLKPEKRRYFTRGQITTETAIHVTVLRDIYITIGDQLDDGSWIVNIQINYLIRWIWLSALLMGLAGIILVFSHRVKT